MDLQQEVGAKVWTLEELRARYPDIPDHDLRHAMTLLNAPAPMVGPDGLTASQRNLNDYARRLGLRLPFPTAS
jgi:hypothetical protein